MKIQSSTHPTATAASVPPAPAFQSGFALAAHNTFGIAAQARAYVALESARDLPAIARDAATRDWPRLVLGGGSNLLLTGDFPGLVLHVCLRGMAIVGETPTCVLVRAGAGESWHALVQWTLAQGLGGLENLSLIPGTVGAAPIQNIGAYGADLKQVLHRVCFFDFALNQTRSLDADECQLGYRDSIFKRALQNRGVITELVLALPKSWQANLAYTELAQAVAAMGAPTAQQISDTVCSIRRRKLPDPAQLGNAGSFFKNPVVSRQQFLELKACFAQLASFDQADGSVKLAAGWLIEQCGWKGRRIGQAGVYEKQALVLVNYGGAKGSELVALAQRIQDDVQARFGVVLEPEPVFV
jgi:UDP-N-acetylmuramate dehydrogenase